MSNKHTLTEVDYRAIEGELSLLKSSIELDVYRATKHGSGKILKELTTRDDSEWRERKLSIIQLRRSIAKSKMINKINKVGSKKIQ